MAKRVSRKAVVAVIVTAIAQPVLMLARSYPWQLALPVAIALGILAYTTISSFERLREERRRR